MQFKSHELSYVFVSKKINLAIQEFTSSLKTHISTEVSSKTNRTENMAKNSLPGSVIEFMSCEGRHLVV